ncbi:MAG: hypothetical protein OXG35_31905 [Acidobacteria bacterium]|nr:hypothetical protein [Acidobacteriota bacterium]
MTKLYALFIALTAIRFMVMPVLALLAWISGSAPARQKTARTWETLASTRPPWLMPRP